MTSQCSIDLLEAALAGHLPPDEETALHRHLEECDECSAALERLAGGPAWSEETALLLKGDDLDDAVPTRDDWSEVDFSVEHLEPSEDPNALGRLGAYDVLQIIGRGGNGVVLKGFDRELKRCVAVKILAPHLAHSALAKRRFAREAQAAAAIVHPNVLAIHQVQPNGRLPFLVMPLVAGESLAQRLKAQGTLELKEILRIGMQAAAGLAAAHEQGLVHRDVKPANILLEKGVERAVLTDFGLARAADDVSITRLGFIAGTPQYMSPEQARGEPLDGRSDLFSLGCVLYEMATGVSPFRANSPMATMRRLVDEQPKALASLNPELAPWFCVIVDRLLEKDPSRRFGSANEVSELLEGCLAHLQQPTGVPLPAALAVPKVRSWRPRSRRSKGVLAMLTAMSAGLLGFFVLGLPEPPDIAGEWAGPEWGKVVLTKTKDTEYAGTYTDTFGRQPGEIRLKWSRTDGRFMGTWREGEDRFGDISVRLVGAEIRGAHTTDPKSKINPGTPRLADLAWARVELNFGSIIERDVTGAIDLDSGKLATFLESKDEALGSKEPKRNVPANFPEGYRGSKEPKRGFSINLPEGYRAVGQRVNLESIAGGFASLAGSRVHVIQTVRGDDKTSRAKTILENVLVIAADSKTRRDEGGNAIPETIVTFALSPEDAMKLTLAREVGTLTIRKMHDLDVDDTPAATPYKIQLKNQSAARVTALVYSNYLARNPQTGIQQTKVRLTFDEQSNTIFVQASPADLEQIKSLIATIDVVGDINRALADKMEQTGMDAAYQSGSRSLLAFDMKVTALKNADWDNMSAQQLANVLRSIDPKAAPNLRLEHGGTYAVQTREGSRGIVRVLGFTDNPKGINIRYKLVQQKTNLLATPKMEVRPIDRTAANPHPFVAKAGFTDCISCHISIGQTDGKMASEPTAGLSAFAQRVPFELGATYLRNGDSITINEVRGTAATIKAGHMYEIIGTYRLSSQAKATLAVYTTETTGAAAISFNNNYRPLNGKLPNAISPLYERAAKVTLPKEVPTQKTQFMTVERGEGHFALILYMWHDGKPHVSFYPEGGEGFAHVYFGTGDSVLKKGWWDIPGKKDDAPKEATMPRGGQTFFDSAKPSSTTDKPRILAARMNLFEDMTVSRPEEVMVREVTDSEMDAYLKNRHKYLPPMPEAAIWRILARNVPANEPLQFYHFQDLAMPASFGEQLKPGMKAVNVRVPRDRAGGGIIRNNDVVDVWLTSTIQDPSGKISPQSASALLAPTLRVVFKRDSIWTTLVRDEENKLMPFTLEANPYRAALIEFAKNKGYLTLVPTGRTSDKKGVPTIGEDKAEDKRIFNVLSGQPITDRDFAPIFQIDFSPFTLIPPGPPAGLKTADKDAVVYSVTKEQIERVEALVKQAPVTTSYLAELFELTPGSKSEYRLRSDVVSRPIVPTEPVVMDFDKLEETLYKMIDEVGFVHHPLFDGHIYAQSVEGGTLIDALIVVHMATNDGDINIVARGKKATFAVDKEKKLLNVKIWDATIRRGSDSAFTEGESSLPPFKLKVPNRERLPVGNVLYLPAGKKLYVQWDGIAASTRHYYGPFYGEPAAKLGLEASRENAASFRRNEVFRLRNAKAADIGGTVNDLVAKALRDHVSADEFRSIPSSFLIVAEPVSNTLLISAVPWYMDAILRTISKLDVPAAPANPAKKTENPAGPKSSQGKTSDTPTPGKVFRFESPISINVIAYSSDGKLIAVANGNPTIVMQENGKPKVVDNWRPVAEILDAETGKSIVTLKLTTAEEGAVLAAANRVSGFEVGALAFSPDDKVLAVGTSVGQVKLFSARTGELVQTFDDEQAKRADQATPEELKSFPRALGGVTSLAFSPDGSLLATSGRSLSENGLFLDGVMRLKAARGVTGPGRLKVWDIKTGTVKHDLVGHNFATDVSFSLDGSLLASAGMWHSEGEDRTGVIIWDPQTGAKLRTVSHNVNVGTFSVAFSHFDKLLATGSHIFDKENGASSASITLTCAQGGFTRAEFPTFTSWTQTVPGSVVPKTTFTPDGKSVIVRCSDESIRFFDTETGKMKYEIRSADSPDGGRWNDFAIAPQRNRIAIGGKDGKSAGIVEVWELSGTIAQVEESLKKK